MGKSEKFQNKFMTRERPRVVMRVVAAIRKKQTMRSKIEKKMITNIRTIS